MILRLLHEARPLRGRIALGVLLGACAVGAGVALMGTSGYLISRAAQQPEILSLTVAIVGVRFFGISRGVFRYGERVASHDAALRLLGRLRVSFFRRLEPLVPEGLPELRSADLLGRFVDDVDALQHLFVRALGPPVVAVLVGLGAALAAGLVDPLAGAIVLVALLLGGVGVPLAAARLVRATGRREAPARAELLTEVLDLFEAAPELAVSGRVDDALAAAGRRDAELRRVRRRSALAGGFGEGAVTLLAGLVLLAVVLDANRIPGVLLAMVALLALASFEAVRPLPVAAEHLGATEASAGRLYELVDREPPVRDPVEPAPAPRGNELRTDELTVRRGRVVALVGPSGVGKTRLAHRLVRFRDDPGRRVYLDGRDLREYRQDDVRAAVLLSDQDAHLFATTIRENLRIAKPHATDDELRAALARARALDWVETLPEGLGTHVGERGALVSGGQRQRIALARAFLSSAGLLIFDEPTAHLDEATAEEVVDTILELAADGRGVLLITHGRQGLDRVDEVVTLA